MSIGCLMLFSGACLGIFLGIIAFVRIHRSKGALYGRGWACAAIVLGTGVILFTPMPDGSASVLKRMGGSQKRVDSEITNRESDVQNTQSTRVTLEAIGDSLSMYYLKHKRCPTTKEGLEILVKESYLTCVPKDSWGEPLHYTCPGTSGRAFDLWSNGRDGKFGGGDDIFYAPSASIAQKREPLQAKNRRSSNTEAPNTQPSVPTPATSDSFAPTEPAPTSTTPH